MTTDLIPQTKEDITKELIQGLLRPKFPRITVNSIEILKEVHGTASNIYLKVDHQGADELPGRMWLKAGLPTVHLERVLTLGLYAREAKFLLAITAAGELARPGLLCRGP